MNTFERRAEAIRLACAIKSTRDRFQAGMMTRATWWTHVKHLASKAEEEKVTAEVMVELMKEDDTWM